jgi:SAM-dependent methyltransferase
VARRRTAVHSWASAYHRRLGEVYRFLVSPNQRVLELGCGEGDLLAALQPAEGVGVDFSAGMLEIARSRHPGLKFVQTDVHDLSGLKGPFDAVILSDLVNDLWDVQQVLAQARRLCSPRTRLILNCHSHLWQPVLWTAQRLRLATPMLGQNWLTVEDIYNLLLLADFEPIRHWPEVLFPLPIPLLNSLCDRFLARTWPFRHLALSNFVVARPRVTEVPRTRRPSVTVVVPARNESGNIAAIFERLPKMGSRTELIFVEGHSRDDTWDAIQREIAAHPRQPARLFRQSGIGKADAVRKGFTEAKGEVLMILDADLTVPPEDLSRFYEAIVSNRGEFINGVRLVYPMERQAMRALNLLGNKFFSLVFSWMLGQPIKDTLCGTKVLWREDYERIAANRSYFGEFDPFGDYDLIFGAAKQNLKIVDLPIRYRERTYGTTNIQRWKHGWLLLRMVLFAARRLKFV